MTISEVDVDRIIRGPHDLEEQIDKLLDLILLGDDKQKYYEEIIRRLTTNE